MKQFSQLLLIILIFLAQACNSGDSKIVASEESPVPYDYAIVLHGGAGSMNFENLPEPGQKIFKHALDSSLQLGLDVLINGGTSLDAVEVVIRSMENNPLFNAGKGAVFTNQGKMS